MHIYETSEEVVRKLFDQMYDENTHIVFTGGETVISRRKKNTVKILEEMNRLFGHGKCFKFITWETNGTQQIREELHNYLQSLDNTELFFSVSPKMFNTSGEKVLTCPDIVKQYHDISDKGQLKFVCNGR